MRKTLPPYLAGATAVRDNYPALARYEVARSVLGAKAPLPEALPESLDGLRDCRHNPLLLVCQSTPRAGMKALLAHLQINPAKPKVSSDMFSTGDRFCEIYGDFAQRTVWVVQGATAGPKLADRLTDALQAVWAARHAESQRNLTLFLPSDLDPQQHPTELNRLVARLAKVSGAQRIFYLSELDEPDLQVDAAPRVRAKCSPKEAVLAQRARLPKAPDERELQAIQRIASSQAKHLARRRTLAGGPCQLEVQWRRLASKAALQLLNCEQPGASKGPYVVLGVHTGSQLPARLAAELRKRDLQVVEGRHHFDKNEGEVILAADSSLTGRRVVVIANTRSSPDSPKVAGDSAAVPTLEALLLVQKARDAGAAHISVVQAYQMNGRSDRKFDRSGDKSHFPPYAALVAAWFKALKPDRHILVEAHDMHTLSLHFDPKRDAVGDIGGMEILLQHKIAQIADPEQAAKAVLAWPDAGSRRRGEDIERYFPDRPAPRPAGENPDFSRRIIVCDKIHNAGHDTGVKLSSSAGMIDPDINVYLPDDEVGSGRTLAGAIALLRERGAGRGKGELHALISHNNLPVSPALRNLLYAWFRASGAASVCFLDTQPTGTVVRSYDELQALGVTPTVIEKFCADRNIMDWPAARYESLFGDLHGFVQVISAASVVAQKLAP